ncbi:MAG: helix-turn-helix domain-containing protein [Chloroflexota bacterium]|nr:helix-turn-helix domain-containing protein [Chloroflexota bacterium]
MTTFAAASLSAREAAELLGRDRTRVYALMRSGDLVGVPDTDGCRWDGNLGSQPRNPFRLAATDSQSLAGRDA